MPEISEPSSSPSTSISESRSPSISGPTSTQSTGSAGRSGSEPRERSLRGTYPGSPARSCGLDRRGSRSRVGSGSRPRARSRSAGRGRSSSCPGAGSTGRGRGLSISAGRSPPRERMAARPPGCLEGAEPGCLSVSISGPTGSAAEASGSSLKRLPGSFKGRGGRPRAGGGPLMLRPRRGSGSLEEGGSGAAGGSKRVAPGRDRSSSGPALADSACLGAGRLR